MKKSELQKAKLDKATERGERWKKLTTTQQIKELDRRLGRGVGAAKQRARLQKILDDEKAEVLKSMKKS